MIAFDLSFGFLLLLPRALRRLLNKSFVCIVSNEIRMRRFSNGFFIITNFPKGTDTNLSDFLAQLFRFRGSSVKVSHKRILNQLELLINAKNLKFLHLLNEIYQSTIFNSKIKNHETPSQTFTRLV